MLFKTIVDRAQAVVLPRTHHGVSSAGVKLPPTVYRMGGAHFRQDDAFVSSAVAEVERLEKEIGLSTSSRLLDWGCGAGRLAVGVVEKMGRIDLYHGVDVQKHLVDWAERHIGNRPGFTFTHVDLANARYNPGGAQQRTIPGGTADYDGFYAFSVFSHLMEDDTAAYLGEVSRLLRPGGRAFVTAFVEEGVPDVEENPVGHGPLEWSGPLHCVRSRAAARRGGWSATRPRGRLGGQGQENDGQSLYILRKP